MFERFTPEARTVVEEAQQVARDTSTRNMDTRHLLLALVEPAGVVHRALAATGADVEHLAATVRADLRASGLDGDALAGLGIDLDAVRRRTDAVFGEGALDRASRGPRGHVPFTADAKKALKLALREAIRLKQRSVGTAHLVLGILRAECPGREALVGAGVDPDVFRGALEEETKAA